LDDFEDLSPWGTVSSGQARLSIGADRGPVGAALALDFDFRGGRGFVVAKRPISLVLPERYAFRFWIRGLGPANDLEFKLVDPGGANVWRHREASFALPPSWREMEITDRMLGFAWGPKSGGRAREIGALEIAIAAGAGGAGTVWIADLRLEDRSYREIPRALASGALAGHRPELALDVSPETSWRSGPSRLPQWLSVDFREKREIGGLAIRWDGRPLAFAVLVSDDGQGWRQVHAGHPGPLGRSDVYLPDLASRFLRLTLDPAEGGEGVGIGTLEILPSFRAIPEFFEHLAGAARRGLYPRWLSREQSYWTLIGQPEGGAGALMNEEGMVEVGRGGFSIEPFLTLDGRFLTWAEARIGQSLERGYLPIPSVVWEAGGIVLTITAFVAGTRLYLRYRVRNAGVGPRRVSLFAAVRPIQVTPCWQSWREYGGLHRIRELDFREGALWVDGKKAVVPGQAPEAFGAAPFERGAVTEYLDSGRLPEETAVIDPFGYASGALRYDFDLAPEAREAVYLMAPLAGDTVPTVSAAEALKGVVVDWDQRLGGLEVRLPPEAQALFDTFRSAAAHILTNREGRALQPGPRRYARAWIRDGAIMAAALARLGLTREASEFAGWYALYQASDGGLPDCVDRDGPEWLPEHDSLGEFIYTVMEGFRLGGDRVFLAGLWPAVKKTVTRIETLRRERLTPEYEEGEKRCFFGLLPESMSHEGYMAHPGHAYWDDFWAVRGLKDAAAMAAVLGDPDEASRIGVSCDALRADLHRSIEAVMAIRGIDYLPASVDLADFDPTATAIAITIAGELERLPPEAARRTFLRYLDGLRERRRGETPWQQYTPYELRIVGAMVRLGLRAEAHELLDFFMAERRIPAWNQWPEIAWRDPRGPSFLGDLPHAWIGAEFMLAFLSLFAYEREADRSLVLTAGVPAGWLTGGHELAVEGLSTHYGKLGYTLRQEGPATLRLSGSGDLSLPEGGVVIRPPLPGPLSRVEVNGEPLAGFDEEGPRLRRWPAEVDLTFRPPPCGDPAP
jgi:hypothetical protein